MREWFSAAGNSITTGAKLNLLPWIDSFVRCYRRGHILKWFLHWLNALFTCTKLTKVYQCLKFKKKETKKKARKKGNQVSNGKKHTAAVNTTDENFVRNSISLRKWLIWLTEFCTGWFMIKRQEERERKETFMPCDPVWLRGKYIDWENNSRPYHFDGNIPHY